MRKMQPLDFIRTKEGGHIGMITEVSTTGGIYTASVEFIGGEPPNTKSAWWYADEFEIIDSLPDLLSRELKHPFGNRSVQPFKLSK